MLSTQITASASAINKTELNSNLTIEVNKNSLYDVLAALHQYKFNLTGSRELGGARLNSDWDFFCQHTNYNIHLIEELGFEEIEYKYKNYDVVCVYRHKKLPIDIQVVMNVNIKLEIQQYIKVHYDFGTMPKDKRIEIWQSLTGLVYAVANLIQPF